MSSLDHKAGQTIVWPAFLCGSVASGSSSKRTRKKAATRAAGRKALGKGLEVASGSAERSGDNPVQPILKVRLFLLWTSERFVVLKLINPIFSENLLFWDTTKIYQLGTKWWPSFSIEIESELSPTESFGNNSPMIFPLLIISPFETKHLPRLP